MLRIASGTTDQYLYFTAPQGLSTWTVMRARNGGTPTTMTTPTIAEEDSAMPGVYSLLLDEDMTIGAGNYTEHMIFYISADGWPGTAVEIELFDPAFVWAETLGTTGYSASALLQLVAGVTAGKLSGAATTTITIRNVEDDENLVVATVDADGNRSAITISTPST